MSDAAKRAPAVAQASTGGIEWDGTGLGGMGRHGMGWGGMGWDGTEGGGGAGWGRVCVGG